MTGHACLLAVLSMICLQSASGMTTASTSPRYSTKQHARTLDEILRLANSNRTSFQSRRMGSNMITDGLDMVLTRKQYAQLYGGPQGRAYRKDDIVIETWPNGEIPYEISYGQFTPERLSKIKEGMMTWQTLTCVTFRPATPSDRSKVQIWSGDGCWSMLGKIPGKQAQRLSLNYDGCFYQGTVEHELGHAIGLVHEHQRPEREDHLGIYESNVNPYFLDQVQAYRPGTVDKLGLDYDYYSIMHYGKTTFAYDRVSTTLFAYDRKRQQYLPKITEDLGKVIGPSFIDVKLVNLMYNCSASCRSPPRCSADCFVDKHCRCVCKEDMPPVPCANYMAECETMAHQGRCSTSQPYLEYFCRKACKMCPDHGTLPPEEPQVEQTCEDKRPDCQSLADRGDCETLREAMMMDCYKTCNGCSGSGAGGGGTTPPSTGVSPTTTSTTTPYPETTQPQVEQTCEDKRPDCQVLADRGDCETTREAMLIDCYKTCTGCSGTGTGSSRTTPSSGTTQPHRCEDKRRDCPGLAERGDCDTNPEAMRFECYKSCTGCTETTECVDDDENCGDWAEAGYCDDYPQIIPTCEKSCGVCS